MDAGTLADQEPFTTWLRRGVGKDHIFVEPKLCEPLGTAKAIRERSRQRFDRPMDNRAPISTQVLNALPRLLIRLRAGGVPPGSRRVDVLVLSHDDARHVAVHTDRLAK